jgi:hypothetical protein
MISTQEIKCTAAHPDMPLQPLVAFRQSPSSIRILDVPRKIGSWEITRVYIQSEYPDGVITSKDCIRTGSVWVGTIDGSSISGKVDNGYSIRADGIDEDGNPVENYVLGIGDVVIMEADRHVEPGEATWTIHIYDTQPENPKKGDAYLDGQTLKIWDGTQWKDVGGVQSYIEMDDRRIDANGYIYINDEGEWRKDDWLITGDEWVASLVPSS